MKKPYFLFLFAAAIITFYLSACKKDNNENQNTNNTTNYTSPSSLFEKYAPKPQKFTIDAGITANLTLQQGTYFNFLPGVFVDANGNDITGKIDLEIIEVYKKSDMIFSRINTSTYPDNLLLESAGMFNIKATQNGNSVFIKKDNQYIATLPAEIFDSTMKFFNGSGRNIDFPNVLWRRPDDTVNNSITRFSDGRYIVKTNNLSWVNVDKFTKLTNSTSAKINHSSDNPSHDSTFIFLVFKDKSVIELPKNGSNNKFHAWEKLPLNAEVTIFAITTANGKLYSAFQPVTLTNQFETTISVKETTEEDLVKAIRALDN